MSEKTIKKSNLINNKEPVPIIYERVQVDILSGKFQAGDWIIEQKICEEYNVSRTPVREALRQLEADGMIKKIRNRGYFALEISKQAVKDMLEMRTLLEVQCVQWAIERITEKELKELGNLFSYIEYYTEKEDIGRLINVNKAFHKQIHLASKNEVLIKNLELFNKYISFRMPSNIYASDYLSNSYDEHRAIFDAFLYGDAEAGKIAMSNHMKNSIKRKL